MEGFCKDHTLDGDEILNPYANQLEAGRVRGREAGLQRGNDEGYVLGCQKAWEYQFEVGYYSGVVEELERSLLSSGDDHVTHLQQLDDRFGKFQRILRNLKGLRVEIEAFPSVDELFDDPSEQNKVETSDLRDSSSEEGFSANDVAFRMQRIRAKFKLLGAQLGLSTILSLRHVLDPSTFQKGGEMGMTTSANVTESNEKGNPNLQHENLKIDF